MGIMGNTQGVNKAAKPDRNAMKKIPQSPFLDSLEVVLVCESSLLMSFSVFATASEVLTLPETLKVNSTSVGGKHLESSHTINSTNASMVETSSNTSIF